MRQDIRENLQMALGTLATHKLRSFLTVLGVIIGTTTVIAVGSIIAGLNKNVVDLLEGFGTNTAFIFKFNPGIQIGPRSKEERMRKPLSYEDALAVREGCPAVKAVSVETFVFRIDIARFHDQEVVNVQFTGATPEYEQVLNAHVAEGRFFTEVENQHKMQVAVIGYDVREAFFPRIDPIGQQIIVNGQLFTVIGTYEKRKGSFFGDTSNDKVIQVPYWTYRKLYPQAKEHFIAIQAYPGQLETAMDQVRAVLRRQRNVPYDKPDNFGISTAESIIEQFHQITGAVALVMVVISSIGLLVGGVGVMNIMLVSVTERTREIGVRKAIGARKRDIVWQFLMEAITLTSGGGVIGIFLGIIVSLLINWLLPSLPSVIPAWAIVAGFVVSASVGLLFGLWPAIKAARLDPVEALRYE